MNDVANLLTSGLSSKVRKAAIFLQKNKDTRMEDLVIMALREEMATNKSWQTQSELISCIGVNKYMKGLLIIEDIVNKNIEYDIMTIRAGCALIRMKRSDLTDVYELVYRVDSMRYSLGYGMLDALGYDRMHPNEKDIFTIIKSVWDFGIKREMGTVDPRYGLAAACAGWDRRLVSDFLHHCIATGDAPLKYVAMNSLNGKYVKLR